MSQGSSEGGQAELVSSVPAGYSETDQWASGSRLGSAVSQAGSFFWTVVTFPGGCWLLCARLFLFLKHSLPTCLQMGGQPTQRD